MSNVDSRLKKIFTVAVTWSVLIVCVMVYLHFAAQHRQAQRELIYQKAVQQSVQEKHKRQQEYEKRRREAQLRREYNQGKVVGSVSLTGQP